MGLRPTATSLAIGSGCGWVLRRRAEAPGRLDSRVRSGLHRAHPARRAHRVHQDAGEGERTGSLRMSVRACGGNRGRQGTAGTAGLLSSGHASLELHLSQTEANLQPPTYYPFFVTSCILVGRYRNVNPDIPIEYTRFSHDCWSWIHAVTRRMGAITT